MPIGSTPRKFNEQQQKLGFFQEDGAAVVAVETGWSPNSPARRPFVPPCTKGGVLPQTLDKAVSRRNRHVMPQALDHVVQSTIEAFPPQGCNQGHPFFSDSLKVHVWLYIFFF
jgi:hypothetical protein